MTAADSCWVFGVELKDSLWLRGFRGFREIRTAPTARHDIPVEIRAIQIVAVRNFIAR
jgi:hypothetical protein